MRAFPSSVGTSISEPKVACKKLIGTSQSRSSPSRSKISCSLTCNTQYKSPADPPQEPASPLPVDLSRAPESTPAGTRIVILLDFLIRPSPRHSLQGLSIVLPVPLHVGHVC